MNSNLLEEQLLTFIAELTGNPRSELSIRSTMHDTHGWNSLNHLAIISYIESQIGKRMSIDEIILIDSIEDCVEIIRKYRSL